MTAVERSNRYQDQPLHVKALRWLRYMPIAYILFVPRYLCWAAGGYQTTLDIPLTWRNILNFQISDAQFKMRHYLTLEEAFPEYHDASTH